MIEDPADLIRLVADPVRLALLGRAAEGNLSLDEVTENFDMSKRKVVEAVGKLRAAGLIADDMTLRADLLQQVAAKLPSPEAAAAVITDGPWSDQEKNILRRFFSGARLSEIPTSTKKRRLVLERLAQEFEPGLRYQERDVNFTLQLFHEDYVSLRRYMVEEDILTRAEGVYWRTGGRFPSGTEAIS